MRIDVLPMPVVLAYEGFDGRRLVARHQFVEMVLDRPMNGAAEHQARRDGSLRQTGDVPEVVP